MNRTLPIFFATITNKVGGRDAQYAHGWYMRMGDQAADAVTVPHVPHPQDEGVQLVSAVVMADGKATNGTDTTDPFAAEVPERPEDHKIALRKHQQRFFGQILGWGVKLLLAAICFPILYHFTASQFVSCGSALFPTSNCRSAIAISFLPPFVLLCLLGFNFAYHIRSEIGWDVAMGKAQQFTNRQNVADGYTNLFSIYVRTKRRSYHVMAWGLLALLYALAGTIVNLSAAANYEALSFVYWLPTIVVALAGGLLLWLSYALGSSYLPGAVIVRHTLALIIYAVSNITDPNLARRQAAQEADQFVRRNPWWFYSH